MAVEVARPARVVSQAERRERWLFVALLAPNLLLFSIFTYWPLIYNFYLSFVNWNFLRPERDFVWFDNYVELFRDAGFYRILGNTLIFTAASVGLTLALGLALAMLINQPLRWRNTARAVLFAPVVLSGAAIGIVWLYIFDPRYGLLDQILGWVGLTSPNWLLDRHWAMVAVVIVYVWKNLGYAVVIFLAGLQGIPRELYEAARVDGAGPFARFRHITLPGLSPISFFLTVTSILACFQSFDILRTMTEGGPAGATRTLIYHLYELGFVSFDAGAAGVVAMVLFSMMLVLTVLQFRYSERRVHYEVGE